MKTRIAEYLTSYKKEINTAILKVLNSGKYILGENVKAFESEFSKILADKKLQKEMGLTNLNYIKKQAGATSKILLKLKEVY